MMKKRYIDISRELFGYPPFPDDPAPERFSVKTVAKDGYALTAFYACAHNGTHMDAPCHFVEGGSDVAEVELDKCAGTCYVADSVSDALAAADRGVTRIIFKGFDITLAEAEKFSDRVVLLGMDGASFGANSSAGKVHRELLGKGIVLLENLALEDVETGEYELIAFPLKLGGSDGSPVRAVLVTYEK